MTSDFFRRNKLVGMLGAAAIAVSPGVALADPVKIGPQDLGTALNELAREMSIQLVYSSDTVNSLQTGGVSGDHTPESALAELLRGTGIIFENTGQGVYVLKATVPGGSSSGGGSLREMPQMVVSATRTERDVRDVPASVTVISSQEITEQHADTPEQLLTTVQGVDIKRAASGLPAEVSLRGMPGTFAGSATQYLVNGMPVEPIGISNRVAWQLVAPQDIERIEVVRGPASALYGPNAAGGVINIITKEGEGSPSVGVRAGYGSHSAYSVGASAQGTVNAFRYRLSANQYETDGFKALPEPDPWGSVDLDGRDQGDKNLNLRLGYRLSNRSDLSVGYAYFDAEGSWLGGHPNYRWYRDGYAADITLDSRISETLRVRAKLLAADYTSHRTFDEEFWNGDEGNLALAIQDFEDETTQGAEVQTDIRLGRTNTLTAGVTYNAGEVSMSEEDAAGIQTGALTGKSRVAGVFVQDEHRFGDRVIVTIGGRYDDYRFYDDERYDVSYPESDDAVFNPRAGARFKFSRNTSLYVSAGTAYLPALNTLKYRQSSDSCTTFCDNPDLKPERTTTYEVGLDQRDIAGMFDGTVSVFHTTYTDKITANSVGAGFWPRQFQNIGEIEVQGVELTLDGAISENLFPFFNYTYSDAEITGNPTDETIVGNVPAYIPEKKASVGFVYDHPDILTARLAARYVGEKFYTDANESDKKADSYVVTDLKVSRRLPLGKESVVSIAVNNLLDKEYSEYAYETADGRNYWLEFSSSF